MKFNPASLLIVLTLLMAWNTSVIADDNESHSVSIDIPPASLEQWYKPANKRQVWLHTMFRLRREMQAISEYASQNDHAAMTKWIKRLEKDYNKIADMVPEWEKQIKPRLIDELEMFAEKQDVYRLGKTLEMIERTCDDCHTDYQPQVTAIYRSPYYDDIKLKDNSGNESSLEENMEVLSDTVNRILIALDDGKNPLALKESHNLSKQLDHLASSCNTCHKDDAYPQERILGKENAERFKTLQTHISAGQVKDSQKMMGEIAVTVCARCHNVHKIVSDLRNTLIVDSE